MNTIVEEISQAVTQLGLDPFAMRLLDPLENEAVFRSALNHFVASGDRRWWWEDFREEGKSAVFVDGSAWRLLPQIAPISNQRVWFIAEDDKLPHYPVYETTPEIASLVIAECFAFEYYVVAKDLSWLLCETHHNVLCAVGSAVEERLEHVVWRHRDQRH